MSELTKKRMRYEVLEDIEQFLLRKIDSLEVDINWKSQTDESGEIPDWRKEEIANELDKISEIKEVIKVLPKLG